MNRTYKLILTLSKPMSPTLSTWIWDSCPDKLVLAQGTLGRNVTACDWIVDIAGASPSALAVNWMSPASFVDCTMTSARPLNKLRDHAGATESLTSSRLTPVVSPPKPSAL